MTKIDLTPTEEELQEAMEAPVLTPVEQATLDYWELIRPKRGESDLFCPSWSDDGCGCGHLKKAHAHKSREGTPWCPAHQKACADGPHPFVTLDQYVRRVVQHGD